MNRKQMADEVQFTLGLQDIDSFNERTFIYDKLYQGTIDLLARTKCVVRCLDLSTIAGQSEYTLDHQVLALKDIEDGARRRARRDEVSSDPTFTLIGADVLRISPTPTDDGPVQTWAVLKPQQMAADTDSPHLEAYGAIPFEWHDAIVLYALWHCSDYADDATAQQGERYRILYEGADGRSGRLSQIKVAVNKRAPRAPRRRVLIGSPGAARGDYVG